MRRTLPCFIAAAVTLVLLGSSGAAYAKDKIAILGIEVIDVDGKLDAQAASVAKSLTDELRKRANSGRGPYSLAPNSNKDLLEMKLLSGCTTEGRKCMSDIGKELKADVLLYGKVQKRDKDYQVTVKLLDTKKERIIRNTTVLIPVKEANKPGLRKWSNDLYDRLTGEARDGTLVVKANVPTGTVTVDGNFKASIEGGEAKIDGLPEGERTVRVESDGYEPVEAEVTIKGGETKEVPIEMVQLGLSGGGTIGGPGGGEKPGGGSGGMSKILFGVSAAVAVGGGALFTVGALKVTGAESDKEDAIAAISDANRDMFDSSNGDVCATADASSDPSVAALQDVCSRGDSGELLQYVGLGALAVGAVGAVVFYMKGFGGSSSSKERSAKAKKKGPTLVDVTPAIRTDYVGGAVKFEF